MYASRWPLRTFLTSCGPSECVDGLTLAGQLSRTLCYSFSLLIQVLSQMYVPLRSPGSAISLSPSGEPYFNFIDKHLFFDVILITAPVLEVYIYNSALNAFFKIPYYDTVHVAVIITAQCNIPFTLHYSSIYKYQNIIE